MMMVNCPRRSWPECPFERAVSVCPHPPAYGGVDEGRMVEQGPPEQFFEAPREARTQKFLAKVLR